MEIIMELQQLQLNQQSLLHLNTWMVNVKLPNTGTEDHASLAALGLLGALSGFGLIARKKREDEE